MVGITSRIVFVRIAVTCPNHSHPRTNLNLYIHPPTPGWVQQLSREYLQSPEFIDLVGEDDVKIPTTITHWSYATQRDTRADILGLVATAYSSDKRSIVFTEVTCQF